jgi:hypothetical protein
VKGAYAKSLGGVQGSVAEYISGADIGSDSLMGRSTPSRASPVDKDAVLVIVSSTLVGGEDQPDSILNIPPDGAGGWAASAM